MKQAAKVGFCAGNKMGLEVISFAVKQKYPIACVATCEGDNSGYEEKIAEVATSAGIKLFRKITTQNKEFLSYLKEHAIDLMVLAWWPSIVKAEAIQAVPKGWLNMHPSLLPYNRGKYPYYWSIVERTPFGATLHLINEGVDTGPVVFQKEIPVDFSDTGETLYEKGYRLLYELFTEHYDEIMTLRFSATPQNDTGATFHLAKELEPSSHIDLERSYTARDLIARIRGRTFMKGDSSYVIEQGKKYLLKIIIEEVKTKKEHE